MFLHGWLPVEHGSTLLWNDEPEVPVDHSECFGEDRKMDNVRVSRRLSSLSHKSYHHQPSLAEDGFDGPCQPFVRNSLRNISFRIKGNCSIRSEVHFLLSVPEYWYCWMYHMKRFDLCLYVSLNHLIIYSSVFVHVVSCPFVTWGAIAQTVF